ncbi:MAG: peptidyl-prolyl cis-trans isomerase [Vicinamibacterales bacterium]
MKPEIVDQLKWQKAQAQAEQSAKAMEANLKTAADLPKVAAERGLTVVESPFFLRDEPIGELGSAPEVAARAFTLKEGEVSPALRVSRGWVFAAPDGTEPSRLPQLSEVADRVREDVIREKSEEMLKSRASVIAADLKKAPDFAAAAKKAGFDVTTTELVARGATLPNVGASPEVEQAVFALDAGGVTDAIPTSSGSVIARVAEHTRVSDDEVALGRDTLRDELTEQRRGEFFAAYMTKAKTSLKITTREDVLTQLMGPMPTAPGFPMPVSDR